VISYGVYLWHWPVDVALSADEVGLTGWPLFAVQCAATLCIAVVSYALVEAPIRRGIGTARLYRLAIPVTAAVVIGAVVLGTSGAAPTAASVLPAWGDQFPNLTPKGFALQAIALDRQVSPLRPRILVGGDSVAWTLAAGGTHNPTAPLGVASASLIGCGISGGTPTGFGAIPPISARQCDRWPVIWQDAIKAFHPRALVLVVGAWEMFDRNFGNQTLAAGSPALGRQLERRIDWARGIAAKYRLPLVLLSPPCFEPISTRMDDHYLATLADRSRQRWVQGVVTRYASSHSEAVRLIDLNQFVCPGGHLRHELFGDGVHFTREGAAQVWKWMFPQLVPIVAAATPRSTASVGG
jgi:lysophospholipase L1-like esterase